MSRETIKDYYTEEGALEAMHNLVHNVVKYADTVEYAGDKAGGLSLPPIGVACKCNKCGRLH